MNPSLATRLLAEAIGTFGFFLIGFTGILASLAFGLPGPGVAAAFGFGLAISIFTFGHISGGHFNPAVSLGLAVGGKHKWSEVIPYWIAQVIGGLAAAAIAIFAYASIWDEIPADGSALINGFQTIADTDVTVGAGLTLVVEVIATALFVMIIMAVATDESAPWNGVFAPLAIGGFIFIAALTFGGITSGSFNPARSLTPAILEGEFTDLWVYLIGPLVGGAIGGGVFAAVRRGIADEITDRVDGN